MEMFLGVPFRTTSTGPCTPNQGQTAVQSSQPGGSSAKNLVTFGMVPDFEPVVFDDVWPVHLVVIAAQLHRLIADKMSLPEEH